MTSTGGGHKKILSTLPLNLVKNYSQAEGDGGSERRHLYSSKDREDIKRSTGTIKRMSKIKKLRVDSANHHNHLNQTSKLDGTSQLSSMTMTLGSAKSKLDSAQEKGYGNYSSHQKIRNSSHSKLGVSSSLLNKIRKKQVEKLADSSVGSSTHRATVPSSTHHGGSSKEGKNSNLFNIALNHAKNFNVVEINNYYHSPKNGKTNESQASAASRSTTSQRLRSKIQTQDLGLTSNLVESQQPASLQNKLQSLHASWKNKLSLNPK